MLEEVFDNALGTYPETKDSLLCFCYVSRYLTRKVLLFSSVNYIPAIGETLSYDISKKTC